MKLPVYNLKRESVGEIASSKCRWSFVARPVLPTREITCPVFTRWPTFTASEELW